MGHLPRRHRRSPPGGAPSSPPVAGKRLLLLNIQATAATLEVQALPTPVVTLVVRTVLPDEYVLPVLEELERQKEELLPLPAVFIRLEVGEAKKEGAPE